MAKLTEAQAALLRDAAGKINHAFTWSNSAEGNGYWATVHDRLLQMAAAKDTGEAKVETPTLAAEDEVSPERLALDMVLEDDPNG